MKFVFTLISLMVLALGWLFWQQRHPAPAIALLDIEKVIADSTPGKAGRAHLDKLALHFRQGLQQVHNDYQQSPAAEQQRVIANAEQMLDQQFEREERTISDDLKKIILDEAEKWRKKHGAGLVLPAQLALASAGEENCTEEVLQAVNQREIRFARLPQLDFLQPEGMASPQPPLPGRQ
ncbi:hypothetical protein [Erwinia sp. B116]|uniref:hypothetical protein n=1 Tax=Erwinia sp. B116 TaxID=1561024 RepID=UPI000C767F7C|nr:hypothetical protein [Erwinia sp. B116]PLV59688.1 hypothetical protein NV64_12995 [Erwinia sp. B116]